MTNGNGVVGGCGQAATLDLYLTHNHREHGLIYSTTPNGMTHLRETDHLVVVPPAPKRRKVHFTSDGPPSPSTVAADPIVDFIQPNGNIIRKKQGWCEAQGYAQIKHGPRKGAFYHHDYAPNKEKTNLKALSNPITKVAANSSSVSQSQSSAVPAKSAVGEIPSTKQDRTLTIVEKVGIPAAEPKKSGDGMVDFILPNGDTRARSLAWCVAHKYRRIKHGPKAGAFYHPSYKLSIADVSMDPCTLRSGKDEMVPCIDANGNLVERSRFWCHGRGFRTIKSGSRKGTFFENPDHLTLDEKIELKLVLVLD